MKKKQRLKRSEKQKKEISIRKRKTIKGIMEGKPVSKAMREAGFSSKTAHGRCSTKAKELAPTIQALMEKRGLTDNRLLDVLDDGLKANKVISCNIIALDKEGMKDADSMTKDFVDVEDHPTRHKFLDTALKLKGHMKDNEDKNQQITVVVQKW
jgi:hypothetical protein